MDKYKAVVKARRCGKTVEAERFAQETGAHIIPSSQPSEKKRHETPAIPEPSAYKESWVYRRFMGDLDDTTDWWED